LDNFVFGKSSLVPARHASQLAALARAAISSQRTRQPVESILIAGHTDPVGSDSYNFQLALGRAREVRAEFGRTLERMSPGVTSRIKFEIASCGERRPKATPQSSRRVEIFIRRRAPARPPRPIPRPPAPAPSGFAPVFHPGVAHNHAPTGRWRDVQSDSRTRCKGLFQKINVLDLLRDPAKLRKLPLSDVNECACAFLSPEGVFRVAREVVMFDLPLARRHLDHYRSGKGRDLVVDLQDIVRADAKFRAKLGAQVKTRRSGHIRIEQSDYSVKDFVFALGAIDRLDFEVDRSAGLVHAWFKDRYEWHPVGFGYRRLPGDVRRPSNCVHAAMVELKSSGAADYWMIGAAVLSLSLF
jgi:OmpA family